MTQLEGFYPASGAWKSFRDGTLEDESGGGGAEGSVLLVTSDGTLSSGNTALRDILVDAGYSVTVRDLSAPEDYTGIGVVVMSYGNPKQDNGTYVHPPVGVVALDSWRAVGMGTTLGFTDVTAGAAEVIDATSELAAGVTGTFNAYLSAAYITYERDLSGSPDVVVVRPDDFGAAVVFAYEAGDQMPGRFATTRHVALGYHEDGFAAGLTSDGEAQVLAAVEWARNSAFVAPPPPATPSSLSATGGDSRVTLSWPQASGATSYNAKRALVTGGPYSTIQTGVTSTGYVDATVTNDTPYFYVVSAVNTQGESGNSPEATATPAVSTNEHLSFLITSDEVAMWQDRSVNGPFKSAEDFSTDSPGHWDEMVAASQRNFWDYTWTGPPTIYKSTDQDCQVDGQWVGDWAVSNNVVGAVRHGLYCGDSDNEWPYQIKRMILDIISASQVAVMQGNTALAQDIVDWIYWHSQQDRLDYGNRTLWPYDFYYDINPLFAHSYVGAELLEAYDNCVALVPRNSAIEQWLLDLAYLSDNSHNSLANQLPGRYDGDWVTGRSDFIDETVQASTRLADGSIVEHPRFTKFYNNRRTDQVVMSGMAGVMLNDSFLLERAKIYVKEFVMFAARTTTAQHTFGDHNRGASSLPELGLSYDLGSLNRLMRFLEALARTGDTSLYDFSSSEGSYIPTWGTAHYKTMKEVLYQRLQWIAGTNTPQYTASDDPPPSSIAGDPYYRIKSRRAYGDEIIADAGLMFAAIYYNEPSWVDIINRIGTPTGFGRPQNIGNVTGWRGSYRQRFLRGFEANPYGS